jgi:hypothetical protein
VNVAIELLAGLTALLFARLGGVDWTLSLALTVAAFVAVRMILIR